MSYSDERLRRIAERIVNDPHTPLVHPSELRELAAAYLRQAGQAGAPGEHGEHHTQAELRAMRRGEGVEPWS